MLHHATLLLLLITSLVMAGKRLYAVDNAVYQVLVEKQVRESGQLYRYLNGLRYLAQLQGHTLHVARLKDSVAYSLKEHLREISPATSKVIVLTTMSYPEEFQAFNRRDEFFNQLVSEAGRFKENFLPGQIIFIEFDKSPFDYLSGIKSVLKQYTVLPESRRWQVARQLYAGTRLLPEKTLKLRGRPFRYSRNGFQLKDLRCFSDNETLGPGQLPEFLTVKKRDFVFEAATETSARLNIPFGSFLCIFQVKKKNKELFLLSSLQYRKPEISSNRHFFTLRFSSGGEVTSRSFILTAREVIRNVVIRIEQKKVEGLMPAFYSDNRKLQLSGNSFWLVNHKNKPRKFHFKPGASREISFTYTGSPSSYFEGAIIIEKAGKSLFQIPLKIRKSVDLADAMAFLSENLWLILVGLLFPLIGLTIFLLAKRGQQQAVTRALKSKEFSLVIKDNSRVKIGQSRNPFNTRLPDLGPPLVISLANRQLSMKQSGRQVIALNFDHSEAEKIRLNRFWLIDFRFAEYEDEGGAIEAVTLVLLRDDDAPVSNDFRPAPAKQ